MAIISDADLVLLQQDAEAALEAADRLARRAHELPADHPLRRKAEAARGSAAWAKVIIEGLWGKLEEDR